MKKDKKLSEMTDDELFAYTAERKRKAKSEQIKKQKTYDSKKEKLIKQSVKQAKALKDKLESLKNKSLLEATQLHLQMFAIFGKSPKSQKEFSIETKDGALKLVVQLQDRVKFTEAAEVHIQTIKEVLKAEFSEANESLYKLFEAVLSKNKKGDFDAKEIIKLQQHVEEVNNPDFTKALEELVNCFTIVGTSKYVRYYEKSEIDDSWNAISLNFSSL